MHLAGQAHRAHRGARRGRQAQDRLDRGAATTSAGSCSENSGCGRDTASGALAWAMSASPSSTMTALTLEVPRSTPRYSQACSSDILTVICQTLTRRQLRDLALRAVKAPAAAVCGSRQKKSAPAGV